MNLNWSLLFVGVVVGSIIWLRQGVPVEIGGGVGGGSSALSVTVSQYLLRVGDTGTDVLSLQRALSFLGYELSALDGIFGQETREALLAFQRDSHIEADGLAGPQTYSALDAALRPLGGKFEFRPEQ